MTNKHEMIIDRDEYESLVDAYKKLLEALKSLMPLCDRDDVRDEWFSEFKQAEQAIAKAEGEN